MILEYMIDDKICPIMSRGVFLPDGDHLLATIYCQREKCMAWRGPCEGKVCQDCIYYDPGDPENCIGLTGYCDLIRREPEMPQV